MKYHDTSIESLKLRETTVEDVGLILELIKGIAEYEKMTDEVIATEDTLRKSVFEDKRAEVTIAEFEGEPIGYVLYFYNFSTFIGREGLYLEDIFIYPEYRGRGFGKEIFKFLVKLARDKGCKRMEWVCLNWNKPSIKFYSAMGAIPMSEWTTYRLEEDKIEMLSQVCKNGVE